MRISTTLLTSLMAWAAVPALGQDGSLSRQRVDPEKSIEQTLYGGRTAAPHRVVATAATGPGVALLESGYDVATNGNIQQNIINHGDGTISVARMAAVQADLTDRSSFYAYFDGNSWSSAQRIESARRGWTALSVFPDGREAVISHTGNEFNYSTAKGSNSWTSAITGYISGAPDHIWPRVAVDGSNNVHVVSTLRAPVTGGLFADYYPVHSWSTNLGQTWQHQYPFGDPASIDTTNGDWLGFAIDCYEIDTYGASNVAIMAISRNRLEVTAGVWLAESTDNGATWNVSEIADWPIIPADADSGDYRPTFGATMRYDNAGNLHIVAPNFLVLPTLLGTAVSIFHSVTAPMQHWSAATGWTDMLTFQDIPGFDDTESIFDGDAIALGGAANNTIFKTPSIGFDAEDNVFVTFSAPTPKDVTPSGANLMDVYAIGSGDGGATWGPPVLVTNEAGLEDADASLARRVDDNLHIVYSSDPQLGSDPASGAAPFRTTMMYHAFAKSMVSLNPATSVADDAFPAAVPDAFTLHRNYPNPFNPGTRISFSLSQPGAVELVIVDLHGRELQTLLRDTRPAGLHTVDWTPGPATPSGLYFAILRHANQTRVQKMVFAR